MRQPLVEPENDYSTLDNGGEISASLRVAVVIPVYNRVELLKRTLAGLVPQTYPRHLMEVVIADDGSDEDVSGAASLFAQEMTITVVDRAHDGYGAGQARNLGAAAAGNADILVFFDADCVPDIDAVSRHAAWHHLASNLVVIGSRHHLDLAAIEPRELANGGSLLRELTFGSDDVVWPNQTSTDFRKVLHRRTASLRYGDEAFRSLVSSNFSVDRELFSEVGGFAEDFTRWGGEDTELGWRLWNDGAFFIDEPAAAMYHQTQEDSGPDGWRDEQRASNDGLIQSKIPHRFYRESEDVINETPKVSVIAYSVRSDRLLEFAGQILNQRTADLELIVCGDANDVTNFAERRASDPRFAFAATVEDGMRLARGEFVALLHGEAAPDHRLISRSVSALERRPRLGHVISAYGIQRREQTDIYRSTNDISDLDSNWGGELPVFGFVRRRDLVKNVRTGASAGAAWKWVDDNLERTSHNVPLVWLPDESPQPAPPGFGPPQSVTSEVISDIKKGGIRAVKAPLKAARSVLTGSSYSHVEAATSEASRLDQAGEPVINYIGWSGNQNLGDEAMLLATRQLLPWADITPDAQRAGLLMLGGGTLINRGYLQKLRASDSPRLERVVFGTGVANPEYWTEQKESPSEWAAFVESCAFVGVRGPISASILDRWGVRSRVEIIGDPALSLMPLRSSAKVGGRVVVCPAWTRGLLWGDSDQDVISAFAELIRHLHRRGNEVWALSAFPADDRHIIDMMRHADAPDLSYLAAHEDPMAAMELLATAELVVTERLHGAVLAAAAGTVPVMVEYRPKMRDFAASIDLTDLVIRTDALDGDALIDKTLSVLASRTSIEEKMASRVAELRKSQLEAADRIRRLVEP